MNNPMPPAPNPTPGPPRAPADPVAEVARLSALNADLLAACKAALAELFECADPRIGPEGPPAAAVIEQVKAAIRRAAGREPPGGD